MASRKCPPIPTEIDAPAGPVTVALDTGLKGDNGEECHGLWDEVTRTITLDETIPDQFRWRIYFHELTHVALADSGLQDCLTNEMVEAICNAVASARTREMFGVLR